MPDTQLLLKRIFYTDESTIGDMYWDTGEFECNTLEDTCRRDKNSNGRLDPEEKVYGKTAIPADLYEIKMHWSGHFQRNMPFLFSEHVTPTGTENPGRTYLFKDVMIHWANKSSQILGCIAVGDYDKNNPDWVSSSQKNYNELEPKIVEALSKGRLFLNITGGLRA